MKIDWFTSRLNLIKIYRVEIFHYHQLPGPPTHRLSTVQHRQTQSYFCSFFSVCHVNREKFTFYAIRACNYQRMRQIRMIHANLIKTKMRLFLLLSLSLAVCVVVVYAIGIVIFRVNSSFEYFFFTYARQALTQRTKS